jgi:hypothetical protein
MTVPGGDPVPRMQHCLYHYSTLARHVKEDEFEKYLRRKRYSEEFVEAIIARHKFEVEDCTSPADAIIARFLRIADSTGGLVAGHCKAGRGRTGTLFVLAQCKKAFA